MPDPREAENVKGVTIPLALMATLAAGSALAAPTAETIARNCVVCHGPKEAGQLEIPKIANYPARKMVEMLTGFRAGQKEATIMDRIAKALTDEQIQALAAYFANQ
ncbi:MAG: c-type cytochrome [Geminicoccaceae bacterium]|nr:c-type cytochrome [Geminicoccaceae bacterium]MCS7268072.1 c-type cytochrome [Geminicoccaceae bacterium]MCX7631380.1 c-type cytochrome [Geminicoccaceae bacterium]MDW8124784.1 c-type cytochrome [Geminicoccaceae bacterium]MDW8342362.1 c-type cytochrome [Geminicoccaceae bacterium]